MAYVAPKNGGRWELRESFSTEAGPRSRTLVSFRELDSESIAKAVARSRGGLTEAQVRDAAARAGAPVAPSRADRLARDLLVELGRERMPRSALRRAVAKSLDRAGRPDVTDSMLSSTAEKGAMLRGLLLLADSLPAPDISSRPKFPRLASLRS